MANHDPISGVLPREKLAELAAAPHGEATKVIRQYDPQWGRAPGEKFDWIVKVRRDGMDTGEAIVKAADQEEADELADDLQESDIEWNYGSDGFTVESVEPYIEKKSRR